MGFYLVDSDDNIILGNIVNDNYCGIDLKRSDYNTISGNTLLGNEECITEVDCIGNEFSNNSCSAYSNDFPFERIFLILIIIGGISGLIVLILLINKSKIRKSKKNSLLS
jgi:parallel beta-helix repeat protein